MQRNQIRVLVVDDHPATRQGLAALLSANPAFVLAGSAASGEEALARFSGFPLDLAIIDQRLPGLDGGETARRFRAFQPQLRVVLVSMFDVPEPSRALADAFLFKSEVRQKLMPVLESFFTTPFHSRSELV